VSGLVVECYELSVHQFLFAEDIRLRSTMTPCRQVWTLRRVLCTKREPVTQQTYLELVSAGYGGEGGDAKFFRSFWCRQAHSPKISRSVGYNHVILAPSHDRKVFLVPAVRGSLWVYSLTTA
jgi:hypothetical protein